MKHLIAPSFYSSSERFEQEQIILCQQWNFAGFTTDLEHHNDYICKEIGGKSVIIQNFHGELKAFHNVCSHRFSRIRTHNQGNGALQCPYHAWVYDSEGIPIAIPHQHEFPLMSEELKKSLKLEKWLIAKCGVFVFIKKFDDGVSLKSYLGKIYEQLLEFSTAVGKQVERYEIIINANWKVVVENALESYHIWSVHPNSLGKYGAAEEYYFLYEQHSIYTSNPKKVDRKREKLLAMANNRSLKIDGYQHYFIFPMLTLATFSGMSLTAHVIEPLNATKTKATNYTFMGRFNDDRLEEILFNMNSQSTAQLTRVAWEEDKPICEQVQLGLSEVEEKSGIFSREEQRVYEFHKAYIDFMNAYVHA
ncbi:MAG: aromatic ring-hydroxylating dioxygenase subunit alpha [Ferruginibacter sp.]|nr:aromatic ring-hydroxylating dioxygenase subunit alpha [Ferruginibacter sp.]